MALNLDTQDLENYPGTTKRVTLDVDSLVPYGYEGDEQIVLTVSTTAYSNNVNRTAIQDLYITAAKSGWLKSSGLKNNSFTINASRNTMRIKLDATVSGSDGSGWYPIVLSAGSNRSGDVVAADMEVKIRELPDGVSWNVADDGFTMAYKNCSVEFNNNKFKIISGSISNYYSGDDRSSVAVTSGTSNDCSAYLGFDIPISSETIAETPIYEVSVTSPYTTPNTTLVIGQGTEVVNGEAMAITDGTNIDYFMVENVVGDITLTVASGSITHSYAAGAKVQLLRMQDPEAGPVSPYASLDALARQGVKHMVNQIDYSS